MKTQMRFQKYICLAMIIVGALAIVYSFCYSSGGLTVLGRMWDQDAGDSLFHAAEGKNDANLIVDIQGFNNLLMYGGIVMVVLAVFLYITGCNKRRNYYITNYVATGVCAGGDIILSIVLMALNGYWLGEFKNVDFEAWRTYNTEGAKPYLEAGLPINKQYTNFSDSTAWFMVGFVVYAIVIVAAIVLILNLVWKIMLMRGEKKLLNGSVTVEGGAAV